MAPPTDEFDLIRRHLAPLARVPGALGLRDDAAVVPPLPGAELVVTTDAMVAGVHFMADDPPALIARKLLRVNLSDLAAMAATPAAYLMTMALPERTSEAWIAAFAGGLAADQQEFDVSLVGGDTVATSGPLTFTLTALGWVPAGRTLRRDGAAAGEDVYVSGTIGDAALGLAIRRDQLAVEAAAREALLERLRLPTPRLALGQGLPGLATAGIDVSDGLIADLAHLCRASGVAAEVRLAEVPISPAAAAVVTEDQHIRLSLLVGGDDYELLFTAPIAAAPGVDALAHRVGVDVRRIGRTAAGRRPGQAAVTVLDTQGNPLKPGASGYRHVFG